MATILAPFVSSMKLGSGFNSFTQELCVDNAVVCDDSHGKSRTTTVEACETGTSPPKFDPSAPVAQSVTYTTKIVDKVTDVTDALNVNGAFSVKNDMVAADGSGKFINTNKLKESDLTFMITCKVVNLTVLDHSLTKFSPINGVEPKDFTATYGDSFISGFQEGGEFTALISIKVKDKDARESIVADAKIDFTGATLKASGNAGIDKSRNDLLDENETSISVSWTGGGQGLKKSEEDWTFDTMRAAALKFPELVAKCPVRTHAVLTKYTSLKSFAALSAQYSPLSYEHARVYTTTLQDAYMDYKKVLSNLQTLAFDVANGTHTLTAATTADTKDIGASAFKASSPALLQNMTNTAEAHTSEDTASEKSLVTVNDADGKPKPAEENKPPAVVTPFVVEKAYPATIFGLEAAKMHCRFMMNRIITEVDTVAKHPEIAQDEVRPIPYMSPFLFMALLPIGTPVVKK